MQHFCSLFLYAVFALVCITTAPEASAQFLGTKATGTIEVDNSGKNYFDPAYGFVLKSLGAGDYSNYTQGPTVTVAEPAVEFDYSDSGNGDAYNFITINITDSSIILTDINDALGSTTASFSLTDTAFKGLTFTKVSDTFINGVTNINLIGGTLSFNITRAYGSPPNGATGTQSAIITASTPEPDKLALLVGLSISAALLLARRHKILNY